MKTSETFSRQPITRPILNNFVNFPLCLAPMVGLSHRATKRLVKSYLPKGARTIWPTEMLNSRRLPAQKQGASPETLIESEKGLVPQILGNEKKFILPSIQKLKQWGAQGVDINMGCPVKKALRHNYGVALMGDIKYASEVVRITKLSSDLPVSVKLRAGIQNDPEYLLEFVKEIQRAGASWISLHPRLASEKRRGNAKWNQILKVRQALKIPVIGNGDVETLEDVLDIQDQTDCDMVMVGRALTARPWLFWQLGERLGWGPPEGKTENAPSSGLEEGAEYGKALLFLIQELKNQGFEAQSLRQLKFFVRTSCPWLEYGQKLFGKINQVRSFEEAESRVGEFFSCAQKMVKKTNFKN